MEFWTTLREAELNLFGMSGSGLGALLLAVVSLAIVLRSRLGETCLHFLNSCPQLASATIERCTQPGAQPGQRPTDRPPEGGRYVDVRAEQPCCVQHR